MKKIAGLTAAVLCGLCACFVSCNPDAGEDVRVFYPTYNSDGTIGSSGLSQSEWESLLASIQGESTIVLSSDLTSADLAVFAKALIASGKTGINLDLSNLSIVSIASETFSGCTAITSIVLPETVVSIGKDAFSGCTSLTLVTYGGTMDDWDDISIDTGNEYLTGATIVCSDGKMAGYIYETVTATWGGTGENALADYTFTVTCQTGSGSTTTITKVVASDSDGNETVLSGSDGVYSLSTSGVGGYEAVYSITFKVSDGSASYTYTLTAVEDAEATGGLPSTYGVHVKYSSSGTTYTVQALAVDDGESPVTLSANSDGTYTYTVDEDGKYTSDTDSVVTTYTITLVTSKAPTYSYTYTYVATTTKDYTATATTAISGITITVNATVTETYDGSSSTYEVSSVNAVTIAGDDVSANSDGTYTYTVDSDSTTIVYTITLAASTSGGVSYSYTYDSVVTTKYTAKGGLSGYTVTVYYNSTDSKIEQVTVADDGTTYTATADEDTSGVYTVTISGVEYTLTISEDFTSYSYTASFTATGSLSQAVLVTVDSGGTITAVTVDGTQATVSGSSATVTINSVTYTLTISEDFTSYSYTASFTATYSGTSSAFSVVTVTVNLGEITSVTADGTECTLQEDGTYLCESGNMTYFITISGGSGSYSYTYDEYFGASDTDTDGFAELLSSLSEGCTIVLSPCLTSEQLEEFADALADSSLSSVTVDMSYMTITEINDETFSGCTNITSVILPSSLETIGSKAFYQCTKLTSVTIGDSVTSIGSHAFALCYALTEVTIPDSVTSIGSYAFYDCRKLTSVMIGDSVTTIGSDAFALCSALTEVTIPDSVTSLGSYAFYDCTKLTSVTIGDSVTSLGSGAFCYCTKLTSVTIGDSVTTIGSYAFAWCYALTEVTIPDSVTSIGSYAFYYCTGLETAVIGEGVATIPDDAFYYCSALTTVTIGSAVTKINSSAFAYCSNLEKVYYNGTTDEWAAITIGSINNSYLTSATIICTDGTYTY